MAVRFGLYLEKPNASTSRVYVRLYTTRKGRHKKRSERVGVIPNLIVNTRHYFKGGLSQRAPAEQRDLLMAVQKKLTALTADLTTNPRPVTKAYVYSYLWPSQRSLWPRMYAAVDAIQKEGTRSAYYHGVRRFDAFCDNEEPTADLFSAWVRDMKRTKAGSTCNTYAAGARSICESIGLTMPRKGLRASEEAKGQDLHALTRKELDTIARLAFAEGSSASRIRDAFLCACASSLRSCDWGHFTTANLGKRVRNQKTRKETLIPDTVDMRLLVERNGGAIKLPKDRNRVLRRIAKAAAVECPSLGEQVQYRGKLVPKWHAVTTHVARRTFATLAYTGGGKPEALRKLTGHATDEQLMKYVKPIIDAQQELAQANETSSLVFTLTPAAKKMAVVNE